MKRLISLLLLVAVASACSGAPDTDGAGSSDESGRYSEKRASRDGIGKVYMGREISHVMGHLAAGWLERPEREREERTDLLIERLSLSPDDVVADIGAGTGYFSFPIARRVPEGKVLAVDIQQEMLDMIEARKGDGARPTLKPYSARLPTRSCRRTASISS